MGEGTQRADCVPLIHYQPPGLRWNQGAGRASEEGRPVLSLGSVLPPPPCVSPSTSQTRKAGLERDLEALCPTPSFHRGEAKAGEEQGAVQGHSARLPASPSRAPVPGSRRSPPHFSSLCFSRAARPRWRPRRVWREGGPGDSREARKSRPQGPRGPQRHPRAPWTPWPQRRIGRLQGYTESRLLRLTEDQHTPAEGPDDPL